MTKMDVFNQEAKVVDSIELNDAVFGIEPNQQAIYDAVLCYEAGIRQGTTLPRPGTLCPAPARSRSVRRAQAVPVRVLPVLPSGGMVQSHSARSRVSTASS